MPFEKGRAKSGGRAKGVANKVNADVKAMILEALSAVGGASYLQEQAKENPAAFLSLLSKLLPVRTQYEADTEITISNPRRPETWDAE